MVRCPRYHRPGSPPLLGCEQLWEDAMEIATDHCPTNHDPVGDCEPSWVIASRAPQPYLGRDIETLPDINSYEENL
jgi:hypothetical protein